MSDSSAAVTDVVSAVTSVPGAVDAVANAPQTIDTLFEVAGKVVYGTGYTLAFAVVFPAAFVFAAVPRKNRLVKGIIDGSAAAQKRAQRVFG
jgi:hypothetical protein